MNILVTGGAGFIGSHAVECFLREGHRVVVVDNFHDFYDPAIKERNIVAFKTDTEIVRADICDRDAVARVFANGKFDAVVHLAARAGVRPSIANPRAYVETNIVGTLNMLEAARDAGVGTFLFASSSSVYGATPVTPFHEDMLLMQTYSPYAATKLAGEHLCSNFAHLYGMRMRCLRFFTVYGARQRPDLAIHKFTDLIHRGRPVPQFGDGSTRRDYTYVDDIIQGVVGALAHEGAAFEIFNLGENQTTTLLELIAAIETALGKKAHIEYHPVQQGDMPMTCADISKAKALIGYNPQTKIATGIPKFVEWYLGELRVKK